MSFSVHSQFSTFVSSVRIRRQRNANEFLIVSSINILMCKGGSSPMENHAPLSQQIQRIETNIL